MSEDQNNPYAQSVFDGYFAQTAVEQLGRLPGKVQEQLVTDWYAAGCPPIDYNYAQAAVENLPDNMQGVAEKAVVIAAGNAAWQTVDVNHDGWFSTGHLGGPSLTELQDFRAATGFTGQPIDYYTGGNSGNE